MNILIKPINGVPMVSTTTIAAVCRKGKSNNVYRMAKRLAEMGEQGIIVHADRPAYCMVSRSAFAKLASRFFRHKDETTAIGVVAINNAFEDFVNAAVVDADSVVDDRQENQETAEPSGNKDVAAYVDPFIKATQRRIDDFLKMMADAMRDVIQDVFYDVSAEKVEAFRSGVASKQAECDALRSELDALRRMLKPEPKPASVQTLNGNVSVQQCSAWLTSNGIKDMGEIRLYEWMRNNGLVCAVGTSRNLPTQIALEKGLLVTVSNPYNNPRTGERVNSFTTRVTPKGQAYLFNRLMYYQINPKK